MVQEYQRQKGYMLMPWRTAAKYVLGVICVACNLVPAHASVESPGSKLYSQHSSNADYTDHAELLDKSARGASSQTHSISRRPLVRKHHIVEGVSGSLLVSEQHAITSDMNTPLDAKASARAMVASVPRRPLTAARALAGTIPRRSARHPNSTSKMAPVMDIPPSRDSASQMLNPLLRQSDALTRESPTVLSKKESVANGVSTITNSASAPIPTAIQFDSTNPRDGVYVSSLAMLLFFGVLTVGWGIVEGFEAMLQHGSKMQQSPGNTLGSFEKDNDSNESSSGISPVSSMQSQLINLYRGDTKESNELLFLRSATALGSVLGVCYYCEHWPYYAHSLNIPAASVGYLWVFGVLIATCLVGTRSSSDVPLSRDQTDEWKGWMQLVFLYVIYFKEAPPIIIMRFLVASFIWMTTFGHTMYLKNTDSSCVVTLTRIFQMLFRLNCSAILLCAALGLHYTSYYMVALHSSYFLLVHMVMAIFSSWNLVPRLMRLKLLMVGTIIYLTWDVSRAPIDFLMNVSGVRHLVATHGLKYDWYLCNGIDHWVPFFGMVTAHLKSNLDSWLDRLEQESLFLVVVSKTFIITAIIAILINWWEVMSPDEPSYKSLYNNFYSMVPILAYLIIRNLNSHVRARCFWLIREIGKVSLELYLLQHHLFLSSNANTFLVLLPGFPASNALLVTLLLLTAAKVLFHATSNLREALLPDDAFICCRNSVVVMLLSVSALSVARLIQFSNVGPIFLCKLIGICGWVLGVVILAISRLHVGRRSLRSDCYAPACTIFAVIVIISVSAVWVTKGFHAPFGASVVDLRRVAATSCSKNAILPRDGINGFTNMQACCARAPLGNWSSKGDCAQTSTSQQFSMVRSSNCAPPEWHWQAAPRQCSFDLPELWEHLCGLDLIFAGDWHARQLYFAFSRLAGEALELDKFPPHADLRISRTSCAGQWRFLWRPSAEAVREVVSNATLAQTPLVLSAGLWDMSSNTELFKFQATMFSIRDALRVRPGVAVWVSLPSVNDSSPQPSMTQAQAMRFRDAGEPIESAVTGFVDSFVVTRSRAWDGLHYPADIYQVLATSVARVLAAVVAAPSTEGPYFNMKRIATDVVWKAKGIADSDPRRGAVPLIIFAFALYVCKCQCDREDREKSQAEDAAASAQIDTDHRQVPLRASDWLLQNCSTHVMIGVPPAVPAEDEQVGLARQEFSSKFYKRDFVNADATDASDTPTTANAASADAVVDASRRRRRRP